MKTVLITGASSGIGKAFAQLFLGGFDRLLEPVTSVSDHYRYCTSKP